MKIFNLKRIFIFFIIIATFPLVSISGLFTDEIRYNGFYCKNGTYDRSYYIDANFIVKTTSVITKIKWVSTKSDKFENSQLLNCQIKDKNNWKCGGGYSTTSNGKPYAEMYWKVTNGVLDWGVEDRKPNQGCEKNIDWVKID